MCLRILKKGLNQVTPSFNTHGDDCIKFHYIDMLFSPDQQKWYHPSDIFGNVFTRLTSTNSLAHVPQNYGNFVVFSTNIDNIHWALLVNYAVPQCCYVHAQVNNLSKYRDFSDTLCIGNLCLGRCVLRCNHVIFRFIRVNSSRPMASQSFPPYTGGNRLFSGGTNLLPEPIIYHYSKTDHNNAVVWDSNAKNFTMEYQ